jgi:hypothetical protein
MPWPPLLTPTPYEVLRLQACFIEIESAYDAYSSLAGMELRELSHSQTIVLVQFYDAVGRLSDCPIDNTWTVQDFDECDFDESDWSNIGDFLEEILELNRWLWEIGMVLKDAGLPDSRSWNSGENECYRLLLCKHYPQYPIADLLAAAATSRLPELEIPPSDERLLELELVDQNYNLRLGPIDLLTVPEHDPFVLARGILLENRIPHRDRGSNPIAFLERWERFVDSGEESFAQWMQKNPCIDVSRERIAVNDWVPLGRLCKLIPLSRGAIEYGVKKLSSPSQRRKSGRNIEVRYSAFRQLASRMWKISLPETYELAIQH